MFCYTDAMGSVDVNSEFIFVYIDGKFNEYFQTKTPALCVECPQLALGTIDRGPFTVCVAVLLSTRIHPPFWLEGVSAFGVCPEIRVDLPKLARSFGIHFPQGEYSNHGSQIGESFLFPQISADFCLHRGWGNSKIREHLRIASANICGKFSPTVLVIVRL